MIRSLLTTPHTNTRAAMRAAMRRGAIPRFMPLSLLKATLMSMLMSMLMSTLIASLASLAACGSTAAHTPTQTSAPRGPTATVVPAGTVLFISHWSKGLDGWQASDGWTVKNGLLEMDGQDNRTLTIPYQPTTRNYDVAFQIQVVDVPADGGYFRLHALPTSTASGYVAQVFHLLTPTPHLNGDHPTAIVTLDPSESQDPSTQHPTDYEPRNTMWTYHVEVRDNSVRFRRDTVSLSAAVAIKEGPLSQGPLRIECGLASLRFGQIQITAL